MVQWKKKTPIKAKSGGCLNCGMVPNLFPPDGIIAVGFGSACVYRDDVVIYSEPWDDNNNEFWTGQDAENAAISDPDHDWQIRLYGPLSGRTYQRHGVGEWILVDQNEGFA